MSKEETVRLPQAFVDKLMTTGAVGGLANYYMAVIKEEQLAGDPAPKTSSISVRLQNVDIDALSATAKFLGMSRNAIMADLLHHSLVDLHDRMLEEFEDNGLPKQGIEDLKNEWGKAIQEEKKL